MANNAVKKLTAAILAGVMLFTYTACNKASVTDASSSSESRSHDAQKTSEYIVDNEDEAQKVITCPDDNILGLEKIVLFENKMTAVFDKNTSDNSDGFFKKGNKGIEYLWFSFNNLSPMETKYDITKEDGRYILEASCQYDVSDLIDPEREVKITRLFMKGKNDSINLEIYANDLEVNLYKKNHDTHTQYYDSSEKKWDKVKIETYDPEPSNTTGITISYELNLKYIWGEDLEYEIDGIKYKINYYGNYINIMIENTGAEDKVLGGSRYLQRVKDGDLIDLGRDGREMTIPQGTVKDLTPVRIWELKANDPGDYTKRAANPDLNLNNNETFVTKAHQSYYAEILVYDFDVDKDGIYRLTFGDAELDFELEWITIW